MHIVGMWMERGGGVAERRQVGRCVTASHWCLLSYVGINHDSEMTYFLTPQTNSTFNRSQGLCQTTFSPAVSQKLHLVGLDYRDIIQKMSVFYHWHHLPLCCNLGLQKLRDNNFSDLFLEMRLTTFFPPPVFKV